MQTGKLNFDGVFEDTQLEGVCKKVRYRPFVSEPLKEIVPENTSLERVPLHMMPDKKAVQSSKNGARAKIASRKPKKIDPTTGECVYGEQQLEFMLAVQRYKEENARPFPTLNEMFLVLMSLGYSRNQEGQEKAG